MRNCTVPIKTRAPRPKLQKHELSYETCRFWYSVSICAQAAACLHVRISNSWAYKLHLIKKHVLPRNYLFLLPLTQSFFCNDNNFQKIEYFYTEVIKFLISDICSRWNDIMIEFLRHWNFVSWQNNDFFFFHYFSKTQSPRNRLGNDPSIVTKIFITSTQKYFRFFANICSRPVVFFFFCSFLTNNECLFTILWIQLDFCLRSSSIPSEKNIVRVKNESWSKSWDNVFTLLDAFRSRV